MFYKNTYKFDHSLIIKRLQDLNKYHHLLKMANSIEGSSLSTIETVKPKKHLAKALLLTCMDFRFLEDIGSFMSKKGYHKSYDHFVLAGASLACTAEEYSEWAYLFQKHVVLAQKLHDIKEIICIDHENCGAYQFHYNELKMEEEFIKHSQNLATFKEKMTELFPSLTIKGFYMYLDGKCEEI